MARACARSVVAYASHMLVRVRACWRVEKDAKASPVRAASDGCDSKAKRQIDRREFGWWCRFAVSEPRSSGFRLRTVRRHEGRVNSVAGSFSGAWGCVVALMAVFPPYNDRSGDNLSIGGGLCPRRCLEH